MTTTALATNVSITGGDSLHVAVSNSQTEQIRRKRDVCQGFAPRSKNYDRNILTTLEGMTRHPPFVRHGHKKEAWEKVAMYVRTNGRADVQKANYLLCMKRYETLRDEFKQQEAGSRRASGVTEEVTRKDQLLSDLVDKETDFNSHLEQENEQAANDISIRDSEEFEGHTNRQESLRQMLSSEFSQSSESGSSSGSAPARHSASTSTANTGRAATTESVRFNPINKRTQRSQGPRQGTVEKRMLEIMENINGLVTDIRNKITTP